MACLGVLFAIKPSETQKLKECKDDNELITYIQENVEEEWDEEWLCETDKSWDAMHRCFAGGKLDLLGGKAPLNAVVFGGEFLNTEEDYYVSLKSNALVKEIAREISSIDKAKLRDLYDQIADDYDMELNDEDFDYTWDWFEGVKEFYEKVAKTNRDVIFTVDQ